MTLEELKETALAIAVRNGGRLARLSNGRWKGGTTDQQIPAAIIWELIQEKKLSVAARSNGAEGFATQVALAEIHAGYQIS
jgi:hypothetical protein